MSKVKQKIQKKIVLKQPIEHLKSVIFLYGPHDSGKTKCLDELINLLFFCSTRLVSSVTTKDKQLCFGYTLANSSRKIKLAIKTAGDCDSDVIRGINFAENKKCEMLVAAVRSTPTPIKAALDSFNPSFGIKQMTWVEKYYDKSAGDGEIYTMNHKQAIELCGLIAKLA